MTPRERLLSVLNRQEPDRFPVDLGASATTTITEKAYTALRSRLGLPPRRPQILSFTAGSVLPDSDLLEYFRIDTRGVKPRGLQSPDPGFQDRRPQGQQPQNWNPKNEKNSRKPALTGQIYIQEDYEFFKNDWGILFRRPRDGGLYFDHYQHPLEGLSQEEIRRYPFPRGGHPDRVRGLDEECRALREAGYPVVMGQSFGTGILHGGTALFGFEDYFYRMKLEPKTVDEVSERILQEKMAFWNQVFQKAPGLIDVVTEADDLGTQRGPFISLEDYRERVKPFQKRLFAFIKSRAPEVKILFHSCGAVADFIPDLIEIGVDALNPVQISAQGMDPIFLKNEYGNEICFWGGGVDTQKILPQGTPREVKEDVRRRLPVLLKNGGYVFATVHNIQADVAPENVLALFEAVDEFR